VSIGNLLSLLLAFHCVYITFSALSTTIASLQALAIANAQEKLSRNAVTDTLAAYWPLHGPWLVSIQAQAWPICRHDAPYCRFSGHDFQAQLPGEFKACSRCPPIIHQKQRLSAPGMTRTTERLTWSSDCSSSIPQNTPRSSYSLWPFGVCAFNPAGQQRLHIRRQARTSARPKFTMTYAAAQSFWAMFSSRPFGFNFMLTSKVEITTEPLSKVHPDRLRRLGAGVRNPKSDLPEKVSVQMIPCKVTLATESDLLEPSLSGDAETFAARCCWASYNTEVYLGRSSNR
jgi:hypothetical protein